MDSQAAGLGTREMASADDKPELPTAVQDLIRRLEGRRLDGVWKESDGMMQLPCLINPELEEFFPERASLSTNIGWRSQVRLRVLEAISSCTEFNILDVEEICGGDISRLTASEWELVFRGCRSSTSLHRMIAERLKWTSLAEVERWCLQLGKILGNCSAADFEDCALSARCFLNLASGLRENSASKLKNLGVWNAWEDMNALKHVADVISSAAQLKILRFGSQSDRMIDMDESVVRALSQALIQSSSLKTLSLEGVEGRAAVLLLNALAGDDGNLSIECLRLSRLFGIGDCILELFTSYPSLREVTFSAIEMRPEECRVLGKAIRDNVTIPTIHIENYIDQLCGPLERIEEIACAASSDDKDPVLHLKIHVREEDELMSALSLLGRVMRGEIQSINSFRLDTSWISTSGSNLERIESILPMNESTGKTSVLKVLVLTRISEDTFKRIWKQLLCYLRSNTSLSTLRLFRESLDREEAVNEEELRDLMGLLQVNLTLHRIDVSTPMCLQCGKRELIGEALKQNQERAVYMSVFREANLKFGDAKAGRLFLCGSPRAGKTQLRQTLMRIIQGKSWFGNKWRELWRTKGIEVEFLQNNDKMQISIWDFAGQWIFRTLQNILLPQTNNFCVYLFVYSPFCEKTNSPKAYSSFQTELEEWLIFITSSTKITGHNLPQVLVVISHKDKMTSSSLAWAYSIVEELKKRFATCVDLCPSQECLLVDARKKKHVIPLKNRIFDIFEKLLSEKSPRVPQLCLHLSSLLVTNTRDSRVCPLWPSKKFHDFCAPSFKQFIPSTSAHFVDHSSILTSVISYLNDAGSIIYIPNVDHIIVDPNWLTNAFLGELIALGQDFQVQESEAFDRTMSRDSYTSKNGFVSESVFAQLIETFLDKQPRLQNVEREVLEKILFNLDLCFKLEDTSQYFIPSFIREYASMDEQKHQAGAHAGSMAWDSRFGTPQFAGIRIQCKDRTTMSLTAAFFPRFQMFMRRKLISEMHVPKETVTCSRHYLLFFLDGHQIYVEHVQSEKSHNYVDVLMLCSEHKSREVGIQYVLKHVVQELISFCASSKGCPGVVLVLGVIQTFCVELLIPIHLRVSILIEELKSEFSDSISRKLGDMASDSSQLVEEDLLHYEHTWPPLPGQLTVRCERATNLLWESDVEAVVSEIRQKRIQQLKSLHHGLVGLNDDLAQFHPESENKASSSMLPQTQDCNPASSRCLRRASTCVENCSTQLLLSKIDELVAKVDGLESIVRRLDMKMGHILSLQQEVQSTWSDFMSKVDRVIEYSDLPQHSRMPKRPYITDDVGLFYRMSASLHLGTTVRLRLMCESVNGFHSVKNQEGLMLRVDQENMGWIPRVIEISYKVLYYALKPGVDVTLGLGDGIPEWDDLKTDVVKLDGISNDDGRAIRKGGQSERLKEAWLRIQQTLAPQLQSNYSRIFKLFQVKYVRQQIGGHAWVCEECMNQGIRSRSLTC
ncbi:hypothetical protein MPTK1_8g01980 [Marchantia polymorpha subsp. ruderalis]|nr:hypothetical protein Mp_8g01980 [Marchantia polymorpha subsp. ruderalis]